MLKVIEVIYGIDIKREYFFIQRGSVLGVDNYSLISQGIICIL